MPYILTEESSEDSSSSSLEFAFLGSSFTFLGLVHTHAAFVVDHTHPTPRPSPRASQLAVEAAGLAGEAAGLAATAEGLTGEIGVVSASSSSTVVAASVGSIIYKQLAKNKAFKLTDQLQKHGAFQVHIDKREAVSESTRVSIGHEQRNLQNKV